MWPAHNPPGASFFRTACLRVERVHRGAISIHAKMIAMPSRAERVPGRLVDSRVVLVNAGAEAAFQPIRRIGGRTGWYYANWLWRLRALLDAFVGGVGLRKGSRPPDGLGVGDTVDSWRVEAFEPSRRLRLAAEMKLPGKAWLEFEVEGDAVASRIRQTAIFDPRGIGGRVYWYGLYPIHLLVFAGMLRGIARAVESKHTETHNARVREA